VLGLFYSTYCMRTSTQYLTGIEHTIATLAIERQETINNLHDPSWAPMRWSRAVAVERMRRITKLLNYWYIKRKGL
jgi:hypothetical protein